MKKEYISPEFVFKKINMFIDVLADSKNESAVSGENDPVPSNPFGDDSGSDDF